MMFPQVPSLGRLLLSWCLWIAWVGLAAGAQENPPKPPDNPPGGEKPPVAAEDKDKEKDKNQPPAPAAGAQGGGAAPAGGGTTTPAAPAKDTTHPLLAFLFFSFTGWGIIVAYLVFVALLVWLVVDLRGNVIMPLDLVSEMEEALNRKQYKEAYDAAKGDFSLFGRVMTAGMARLQYGLQEARDAGDAMLESLRSRKEHLLTYVAIIGTLGPLIGLVGTVSGMIDAFGQLGAGKFTPGDLAEAISHALYATLTGIFLSVMAIPVYSFLRNRLARLTLDAELLADDLLTQTYYATKKGITEATNIGIRTTTNAEPPIPPLNAKPAVPEPLPLGAKAPSAAAPVFGEAPGAKLPTAPKAPPLPPGS